MARWGSCTRGLPERPGRGGERKNAGGEGGNKAEVQAINSGPTSPFKRGWGGRGGRGEGISL